MGGNAPAPTDPKVTADAQTGMNLSTATGNAFMQNVNEYGPSGSRTFAQTGTQSYKDPITGETRKVPTFSSTTTLSAPEQAIFDQSSGARLNLATLGKDLSGQLGGQLTQNFKIGNEGTEARLMDLGRKRLDPMFAQRDEDLRTRLANQGIRTGTAAYDREMGLMGQQQNDAYNQLLLQGRGQAVQESLAEDNQRINQIGALMSGGQVSMPQFASGVGVQGAPTTDFASISGNYDNQRMNQWQQNQAATGSLIGGLGGLFSGGATSAMSGLMKLSDARAKDDIEQIGQTDDGLGIYKYRYKGSPKTEIGLMAQDVAASKPHAVAMGADGLMRVNYEEALH